MVAAKQYLARGWQPVPVPAGTKGPRTKGWQTRPWTPEDFAAGGNLGIVLGDPSGGLVDVDLDSPEARELADHYLPATVETGRPGSPRSHRWYICPGLATRQFRDPADRSMIVELRSTGGQTLVGPSIHPETGEPYEMLEGQPAAVPAGLLEAGVKALAEAVLASRGRPVAPQSPAATPAPCGPLPSLPADTVERRAAAYLDAMPPAVAGQGGHAATYAAATALVHGFEMSADAALRMLMDRYNPRCLPAWSVKELQHKVADAMSKPHDRARGWLLASGRERPVNDDVDLSGFCVASSEPAAIETDTDTVDEDGQAAPGDPGAFPEELLAVPGFMGEVMDWNLGTSIKPQPVLALAGAIALQAVLAARKIRDERGNRTNLYLLGLADSGRGKEHARKINKALLYGAGLGDLNSADDFASDSGLVKVVHTEPAQLFQVDEIGRLLKTLSDARHGHLYHIATVLMKLYSSSDSVFLHKAYADSKQNISIGQPCVTLYGLTTPNMFYQSLSAESLADGFLARLIVFETHDTPPRQRTGMGDAPEQLLEAARWWGSFRPGGNMSREHPDPQLVDTDEGAWEIFDALAELVEAESSSGDAASQSLWARVEEKACRLALVYAASRDRAHMAIDAEAARWAVDLAVYTTRKMLHTAGQWVAENPFDARQKRIVRILRDAGGTVTRSHLYRRTQAWSMRERDDTINNMLATGQLQENQTETGGRPKITYTLLNVFTPSALGPSKAPHA